MVDAGGSVSNISSICVLKLTYFVFEVSTLNITSGLISTWSIKNSIRYRVVPINYSGIVIFAIDSVLARFISTTGATSSISGDGSLSSLGHRFVNFFASPFIEWTGTSIRSARSVAQGDALKSSSPADFSYIGESGNDPRSASASRVSESSVWVGFTQKSPISETSLKLARSVS